MRGNACSPLCADFSRHEHRCQLASSLTGHGRGHPLILPRSNLSRPRSRQCQISRRRKESAGVLASIINGRLLISPRCLGALTAPEPSRRGASRDGSHPSEHPQPSQFAPTRRRILDGRAHSGASIMLRTQAFHLRSRGRTRRRLHEEHGFEQSGQPKHQF